ncbi:hypothetical protein ASPACDRAFT_59750 [Aspergillus aculeatus ATCC 16872]|uniref:F-box domain-containing protein n=1 Tax=Aspergillus aculeatus (strain ATCC 16872 / CBS 172.66 / WB 5094) TaxID=690307 RepID=A0A1L9WXP6_ASPA1|nr:uncharacterized protein ASPACDRAFT_59750 [Aspergillus aculeatus ATCC 16872]OJK00939.1 hypothetical protein ASPACDRAFT_59750 [Aspergillus aculeatus ATCC 16872]
MESTNKTTSPLLYLPREVFDMILQLLPPPAQVCLLVTCRGLYHHQVYNATIRDFHPQFQITSDTVNYNKKRGYDRPTIYRKTLLRQLQDDRWAYCFACFKLHPRAEFDSHSCHHRWAPFLALSTSAMCTAQTGIVDLCPCISLTARHKMRIARYLAKDESDLQDRQYAPIDTDPRFRVIPTGPHTRGLVHDCNIPACWQGDILSHRMVLFLDSRRNLIAHTRYCVTTHWCSAGWSLYACPHYPLLAFPYIRPIRRPFNVCPSCRAQWHRELGWPWRDELWVTFTRDLGGARWPPDAAWQAQRRVRSRGWYGKMFREDKKGVDWVQDGDMVDDSYGEESAGDSDEWDYPYETESEFFNDSEESEKSEKSYDSLSSDESDESDESVYSDDSEDPADSADTYDLDDSG